MTDVLWFGSRAGRGRVTGASTLCLVPDPTSGSGHPRAKETHMRTLTTVLKAVDSYTLWAFNPDPTRRSR